MTPLRQKYIRDLTIRGKAENTQQVYTACVADLASYYKRSPDLLSYDQVADWLFHLRDQRKLASSSVNIAVSAARFLYRTTLGRDTAELLAKVPRLKRETKRAHAYSVEEVEAILKATRRPRDIAFLRTVYGCGLRVMEAVNLRARGGIDRARMQIRVEGKGAKERVLPMSPHLLHVLENIGWPSAKDDPAMAPPGCSLAKISKVLSVGGPAGASTTARSKRAACGPRAASMYYAIVLPLISLRVGWNSPWYSASSVILA